MFTYNNIMFDIFLIQLENNKKNTVEKKTFEQIILSNKKSQYNKTFYWINCVNSTEEELTQLSRLTGIKTEHFQDVLLDTERSTITKGKWLFISYRAINKDLTNTTPLGIFSYKNLLITIEKEPIKPINKYKYLLAERKRTAAFAEGKISFIYHLFDNINDGFREKIISELNKTKSMEENSATLSSTKKIENIYTSIVNHIYLQNALSSNLEVLTSIVKGKLLEFHTFRDEFVEIYEDVKELLYMEKMQKDVTNTLFNLHSSFATYELNETMKKITGWGFIIMLPTLIASIYGMNFRTIPFSQGPYDFTIMCAGMFLLMAAIFLYLRKIKWL